MISHYFSLLTLFLVIGVGVSNSHASGSIFSPSGVSHEQYEVERQEIKNQIRRMERSMERMDTRFKGQIANLTLVYEDRIEQIVNLVNQRLDENESPLEGQAGQSVEQKEEEIGKCKDGSQGVYIGTFNNEKMYRCGQPVGQIDDLPVGQSSNPSTKKADNQDD